MKLSERIRSMHLQNDDYPCDDSVKFDAAALCLFYQNYNEILTAVEAMEEGRVLPRLPEGWVCQNEWRCILKHYMGERHIETAPTPAEAAQAAIDKIAKGGI